MKKSQEAFERLKRLNDEFQAARFSIARLLFEWDDNANLVIAAGNANLTHTMLERADINLEITYVIRLFAEFEAILREYWQNAIGRDTEPPISQLMESVAVRRHVGDDDLIHAQEIREYRNDIVHEGHRDNRYSFFECKSRLGKYLYYLPSDW